MYPIFMLKAIIVKIEFIFKNVKITLISFLLN
jgi:hypothetical protein